MNNEQFEKLKQMLKCDEGVAYTAYKCSAGYWTAGVGRNLETARFTEREISNWLQEDIIYFYDKLMRFNFFKTLSENRQLALINMCFNIGLNGFSKFRKMIAALEKEDFETAAEEMLDSRYARQVGERADRLVHILVYDEIPSDWYREYKVIS